MEWLIQNASILFTAVTTAGLIVLAVIRRIRKKKNGGSCGCCRNCPFSGECSEKKEKGSER